ncbi:MAG TPA: hypothetical protein VFX35_09030 [Solirubrobacterales bacterium]|nr:hypothetical protein [Solirubrobacterales bacterium]
MKGSGKKMATAGVIASVAVFGILGCGNSDSSGTVSAPLTKAQFIRAGEQICQERLKEKDELLKSALSDIPPSEAGEPSQKTLTQLGESILPAVQKMTKELSELPGSANSEAAAKRITNELEAGLKKAEADPSVLIQTNPFVKAGKAARAYGFKACAL